MFLPSENPSMDGSGHHRKTRIWQILAILTPRGTVAETALIFCIAGCPNLREQKLGSLP